MVANALPSPPAAARPLRLTLLFAFVCLAALAIGARLAYWQVAQAEPLQKKLNAQHTLDEQVPARRGAIRDTNHDLLAGNLSVDYVYAVPSQLKTPELTAAQLAPVLGVTPERLLPDLLDKKRQYVRLLGGEKVAPDVSEQVAALRLSGIFLEPTTKRVYPEKQLGSHLLGFVDGADQGWYGVEGQFADVVGGKPGWLRAERDTAGNEIGFSSRQWLPPEDGLDLILTIDRTIQYIAERELDRAIVQHRASGGTVIVMRPQSGAILAMASRPAFDPNRYVEFAEHPELFANPAVSFVYEPGSTFKVVTMAAALNERTVVPDTTYSDTGLLSIGGFQIRNWNGKANGIINMTQLLEKSSNIGAAWVASRLGKDRFYKYVNSFGFGQLSGVDIQGESQGIVRTATSPGWSDVDLATNSFGQAISATPLQIVNAVAAIANGGVLMRPYMVRQVEDPHTGRVVRSTQPQIIRQVISRETAATLLGMLVFAAENGETRGTLVPGFKVAGKTGTASIPVEGGYDKDLTIASFVGVAPAQDPQFVILVKIDRPTDEPWGSLIAKPAFGAIAQDLVRYMKLRRTEPVSATPLPAATPTTNAATARQTPSAAAGQGRPGAVITATTQRAAMPTATTQGRTVPATTATAAGQARSLTAPSPTAAGQPRTTSQPPPASVSGQPPAPAAAVPGAPVTAPQAAAR